MGEISEQMLNTISTGANAQSNVLGNQEILGLIFSFFDPRVSVGRVWDIEPTTRKALFYASLTCKLFRDPALNLLWRTMTTLIPVFHLLPEFRGGNYEYSFSALSIEGLPMENFEKYTLRVKYLKLASFKPFFSGHSILQLLSRPNFTLFPSLLAIHLPSLSVIPPVKSIENLNVLFLLPSQSLQTLHLINIDVSTCDLVASFLLALSQTAWGITHIFLGGCLTEKVLCLIGNFEWLDTLSLTFEGMAIGSKIIPYFNVLPQLKQLTIDLRTSSTAQFTEKITGLPSLQILNLSGFPGPVLKILNTIDCIESLETIKITSDPIVGQDISGTSSIQGCISESCRIAPSLHSLHMHIVSDDSVTVSKDTLEALSACRGLVSLKLEGLVLSFNNDDIRRIFANENWKQLRVLHLPCSINSESPSMLSLSILAQHLPNLVSLKLPIKLELGSHEELQATRLLPRRSHCLATLVILKPLPAIPFLSAVLTMQIAIAVASLIITFPALENSLWSTEHLRTRNGYWEPTHCLPNFGTFEQNKLGWIDI